MVPSSLRDGNKAKDKLCFLLRKVYSYFNRRNRDGDYVMSVEIKLAKSLDFAGISKILSDLKYPQNNDRLFSETLNLILSNLNMGVIVAQVDTEIIGLLTYTSRPQLRFCAESFEIDELVVANNYRGKGIGKMLLDYAKDIAIKRKAVRMVLTTNRERESYVRGFYSKYGFVEVNSAWMKFVL